MDYARMGVEIALKNQEYLAKMVEVQNATKKTAKASESFFSAMTSGPMLAAGAFGLVGTKLLEYTKMAGESEKKQAQLKAALAGTGYAAGTTAEEINKYSANLSKSSVFSKGAITEAQTMLLNFTNIKKNIWGAASQAVLDVATAKKTDLVSAAESVGKALENPANAGRALRAINIQLTDSQNEQIKSMMHSGDVAGAQGMIMQELAKYTGRAAAEAGTMAGQQQIMENRINEVKVALGKGMMGGMADFSRTLTETAESGKSSAEYLGQLVGVLSRGAAAMVGFWRNFATLGVDNMIASMQEKGFAAGLSSHFAEMGKSIGRTFGMSFAEDAKYTITEQMATLVEGVINDPMYLMREAIRQQREKDENSKKVREYAGAGNNASKDIGKISNYSGSVLVGNFGAAKANSDLAKSLYERAKAAKTAAEKTDLLTKASEAEAASKSNLISGYQDIISYTQKMIGAVDSLFQAQAQAEATTLENRKNTLDAFINYSMNKELEMAGVQDLTRSQSAEKQIRQLQQQISKTSSLSKQQALQEQLNQAQKERTKYKIIEEAEEKKKKLEIIYDIFKRSQTVKEFERQKSFQYGVTAMNMAAGMLGAVAQGVAQLGPIAGAIVGGIEAAAIGALGAVQMAAIAAQKAPAYERGTSYVPDTGLAMLHRGERVVTAKDNAAINEGDAVLGRIPAGGITINVHGSIIDKVGFLKAMKEGFQLATLNFGKNGVY